MTDKKNNQLQFTYFFGAGASRGTVPLVKDFKNGLDDFVNFLQMKQNHIGSSNFNLESLIVSSKELCEKLDSYASFDTFAKKLFLSNRPDHLLAYKKVLAVYILYCNLYKSIDKRYDLFFASILDRVEGIVSVPTNVNILSWNYDRLAETSLQDILGVNSFQLSQTVNVFNNYSLASKKPMSETFNIVKLNGSAGVYIDYEGYRNTDQLDELLAYYRDLGNNIVGGHISFSWEIQNIEVIKAREAAFRIMSETDHLIVIGYSFPTFNRQIDYELLKALKPTTKIHLQIPETNIKAVKQRLCALTGLPENSKRILEYTETDEFFIPYEFNNIIAPRSTNGLRARSFG